MKPYAGDPIQTQPERTRLAGKRTIFSLLIVVAAGGFGNVSEGQPRLTLALAIPRLIVVFAMTARQRQHGHLKMMSWPARVSASCVFIITVALIGASRL
jgi:hypothetical protein